MITPEQYINYRCVRDVEKKAKKDPYLGTPFITVRNLSSRSKGAFFEKLTKEWLSATFDLYSNKPSSSQHDTIINDVKIEIKGSTLWVDGEGNPTHFRWQQIRTAQDYQIMIFMAMYPDKVKFYYATKQDLLDNLDPLIYNQHGGKGIDSGTMSIDGYPEDFVWMKEIKDASFIQH